MCMSVCLYVNLCVMCVSGAAEARRRCLIPWMWSYQAASMWVLGNKPKSFAKANVLNLSHLQHTWWVPKLSRTCPPSHMALCPCAVFAAGWGFFCFLLLLHLYHTPKGSPVLFSSRVDESLHCSKSGH